MSSNLRYQVWIGTYGCVLLLCREIYSRWSTGSLRYSFPSDRGQSPAEQRSFSRHNISYVRGGTPGADSDLDDLSSLFNRTTTNLFGRDFVCVSEESSFIS